MRSRRNPSHRCNPAVANPKGRRFHVIRSTGYGAAVYWEFDTYKEAKRKMRAMQKQTKITGVDEFWYVYDTKTKEIPNPRHKSNRTSQNPYKASQIKPAIEDEINKARIAYKRKDIANSRYHAGRARGLWMALTDKEKEHPKFYPLHEKIDEIEWLIWPTGENPSHRCNEPLHNPRHKANPASANPRPRRKTKRRYRVPAGMPDPRKKPSYYKYQSRG